jgi:hypothetical protein
MNKQLESVSDFKARLAQMMRERETGKKFAIVGASRAHECVVRKTNNDERAALKEKLRTGKIIKIEEAE